MSDIYEMSEWNKIEMKESILQIWSTLVLYPKHSVFKIGKDDLWAWIILWFLYFIEVWSWKILLENTLWWNKYQIFQLQYFPQKLLFSFILLLYLLFFLSH